MEIAAVIQISTESPTQPRLTIDSSHLINNSEPCIHVRISSLVVLVDAIPRGRRGRSHVVTDGRLFQATASLDVCTLAQLNFPMPRHQPSSLRSYVLLDCLGIIQRCAAWSCSSGLQMNSLMTKKVLKYIPLLRFDFTKSDARLGIM